MFQYFKKYPDLLVSFSRSSDGSMKLTNNPDLVEKTSRNRNAYFLKNNINPEKVVSAGIVHGNKIAIAYKKDGRKIILGADGLLTQEKNLFLSITSADCLPIFLFDPEKEVIGIVHAGWRSLAENILFNAIEKIKGLGGTPKNILAGIGPAICQKHYEVSQEVAEKFENFPEAIRRKNKKTYLDLKKIAKLQLLKLGIKMDNIEISPECTFKLKEKYFSARRDSPLTNYSTDNKMQSKNNNELRNRQLVRGKPAEVEAMIAVIGMKA